MQQSPHSAAAQAKYQEVASAVMSKARLQFPGCQVREVKFTKVNVPPGVEPGQQISLTGAIPNKPLAIVVPMEAVVGKPAPIVPACSRVLAFLSLNRVVVCRCRV
jgi:hypothetical protein